MKSYQYKWSNSIPIEGIKLYLIIFNKFAANITFIEFIYCRVY